MKKYIGITIGPIYETMTLSSKPAALWASSYIFSMLSKKISDKLKIENISLLIPFAGDVDDKVEAAFKSGIGLYHDRIICEYDSLDAVNRCVCEAVDEIAKEFAKSFIGEEGDVVDYFKRLFQIHICKAEVSDDVSPVIAFSDILDQSEYEKNFSSRNYRNYISELFNGKHNEKIKNSFLVKGLEDWQLWGDKYKNSIRDLKDISSVDGSGLKYNDYYAIVYADGDNVGKHLSGLKNNEYIQKFSKSCFEYGIETSNLIKKYGGITIYAGGDDLLCILPLKGKVNDEETNILSLLKKIDERFKAKFKDNKDISLSFGVAIQYHKFPLYEALSNAHNLLNEAKAIDGKNALCLKLLKHSGQECSLRFSKYSTSEYFNHLINMIDNLNNEDMLKSSLYKLYDYEKLFIEAFSNNTTDNLIENIIDNYRSDDEKSFDDYLGEFKTLCNLIHQDESDNVIDELRSVLRFIKFYCEKGGQDDK